MNTLTCPVCGQKLINLPGSKKWICPSEEHDYVCTEGQRKWYKELADNEGLWNEKILQYGPPVIAYEYASLREMLRRGEISGLSLKLKDVFESCLKFCVLAQLSLAFAEKDLCYKYGQMLYKLINELPSLGTWLEVGRKLIEPQGAREDHLQRVLKDLVEVYDKQKIVNWRNENIGHGAFKPVEAKLYRDEISGKIAALSKHFQRDASAYASLMLQVKANGKIENLFGARMARELPFTGKELFLVNGKQTVMLVPLLQNLDHSIYFFDSYVSRKNKDYYLNYTDGTKKNIESKQLQDMRKQLKKITDIKMANASAEEEIILKEQIEALTRLGRPGELVAFPFIEELLEKFTAEHSKGCFLLQMENGMGKTTFVRMLDNLSYNEKRKHREIMYRAFYINPIYAYTPQMFLQEMRDALRRTNDGGQFTGQIPTVSLASADARRQVAEMVNALFAAHQKMGIERLLILIDGLDELPNRGQRALVDFLPETRDLVDNIYLVITCRTDEQASPYTQRLLKALQPEAGVSYAAHDTAYQEALLKHIQKTEPDLVKAQKLLALANGKMVYLDAVLGAYRQYGAEALDDLTAVANQGFFQMLERLYGETYYRDIKKIAACLSLMPISIDAYLLAGLLDENEVTFRLLAYLGELKPVLNITRQPQRTLFCLTRLETREYILSDEATVVSLKQAWLDTLLAMARGAAPEVSDRRAWQLYLLMLLAVLWHRDKFSEQLLKSHEFPELLGLATYYYLSHVNSELDVYDVQIFSQLFMTMGESCDIYYASCQDANVLMRFMSEVVTTLRQEGLGAKAAEMLEKQALILEKKSPVVEGWIRQKLYGTLAAVCEEMDQIVVAKKYYEKASAAAGNAPASPLGAKAENDRIVAIGIFQEKAAVAINTATMYKNSMQYEAAIAELKNLSRKLEVFTEDELQTNNTLLNVQIGINKVYGNIYKRSEPERAKKYFDKAFSCWERLKFATKEEAEKAGNIKVDLLLNMGQTYRCLNDYAMAIKSYEEAIQICEDKRIRGEAINESYYINLHHSCGNVCRDQGKWQEALAWYNKALGMMEELRSSGKSFSDTYYHTILSSRADALMVLGQRESAQGDLDKADRLNINTAKAAHSLPHNRPHRAEVQAAMQTQDCMADSDSKTNMAVWTQVIEGEAIKSYGKRQIIWLHAGKLQVDTLLAVGEAWLPDKSGEAIIRTTLGERAIRAVSKEELLRRLNKMLRLDPAREKIVSFFENETRKVAYLSDDDETQGLWEKDAWGLVSEECQAEFVIREE